MLRRVALVRTDVSEEHGASFIRVTRIVELGTTLAVTSKVVFLRSVRQSLVTTSVIPSSPILVTLMKEVISSSETSVLTRATRRNIPEDAILLIPNDWLRTLVQIYPPPCNCITFTCSRCCAATKMETADTSETQATS
jgi:hypothetical protein